jgi:cell division protein FtsL
MRVERCYRLRDGMEWEQKRDAGAKVKSDLRHRASDKIRDAILKRRRKYFLKREKVFLIAMSWIFEARSRYS